MSISSLHMSKLQKTKPAMPSHAHSHLLSNDPAASPLSSRASSLAGKKRPRESDPDGKIRARRTKSTGDAKAASASSSRDREAFQRSLIGVFVPKALQESKVGNLAHYNDLLAHFLPTPTTPFPALPPLLPLLRAISANVSLLDPETHGQLLSAIMALRWAEGDERFVRVFIGWAGVLVSAQPGCTKEMVAMAVKGLTWQPVSPIPSSLPRRTFHARHHLLLSHLLSLVPTLPSLLQPLIIRNFPNKREPEVAQTTWVRNMSELIAYCPELAARVWGEVVGRMLGIDVEITNTMEAENDSDSEDDDDDDRSSIPEADPLDLPISADIPRPRSLSASPSLNVGIDSDDSEGDPDPDDLSSAEEASDDEAGPDRSGKGGERERLARLKRLENVKNMREKLDGMLVFFFQHLEEYMGGKSHQSVSAVDLAARELGSASGASTPTSEYGPGGSLAATTGSSITSNLIPRRPISPAQSLVNFQTLLNLFSRQILPTAHTQHIPFLLFLTSSFSPAHTDLFLGLLVSQALYATTTPGVGAGSVAGIVPVQQRIAATVYIGSIVCRARYVSDDQARTVLTYLLAYIDGKLHQSRVHAKNKESGGIGMEELPLFYAVCQSVMLIFCFRWRAFLAAAKAEVEAEGIMGGEMDIEGEGDGDEPSGKWISDLDVLQRAITSDLNPLLGCNPTIVSTFAKVSHHTNFLYCFSIIEANQQLGVPNLARTSSTSSTTTRGIDSAPPPPSQQQMPAHPGQSQTQKSIPRTARHQNILSGFDSYFPFDPYDLPKSMKWVERLYRTWGEVSVGVGDESDSEDESASEDDSAKEEEDEGQDEDEDDEGVDEQGRGHGLSNHLSPKGWPLPTEKLKIGNGVKSPWAKRGKNGQDGGLSRSLEGMSISPGRWAGTAAGTGR